MLHGVTFRLRDQMGKVVLLFFGYTHCPDVCPTTLADYKVVYNELGEFADQVRFVYITVDPERDTPEVIASYAKAFNPAFIGLSGDDMNWSRFSNVMVSFVKNKMYKPLTTI